MSFFNGYAEYTMINCKQRELNIASLKNKSINSKRLSVRVVV